MAASREWTQWHLTPSGWIAGTSKLDFVGEEQRPTPNDRVKTCLYREEMSSPFSKLNSSVETVWVGDASTAEKLEAEFGPCPHRI